MGRDRQKRHVEEDDNDDRPRKKKKKGGNGLLIGLIAGAAVLVVALIVLLVLVLSGSTTSSQIIGKWKTERTVGATLVTIIVDFQPDGKVIHEVMNTTDFGGQKVVGKTSSTHNYKITGDILEGFGPEGPQPNNYKVEINGDTMTWTIDIHPAATAKGFVLRDWGKTVWTRVQ